MRHMIPIIAPMKDPISDRYNMDFTLKLKKNKQELTLENIYVLHEKSHKIDDTEKESNTPKIDKYSAAGYYLTSFLRKNGYDTFLTNGTNETELKQLAALNPLAVCISSTLLLEKKSLQLIVGNIRMLFPEVIIIIGGILVWKSRMFVDYIEEIKDNPELSILIDDIKKTRGNIFPCSRSEIDADIFVISPHGTDILLKILKRIENGSLEFSDFPNIATADLRGDFIYHKQITENIDLDKEYTDWCLIDELPYEIPMRSSIGCPYRCKYCDFCSLFSRIYLRSGESIKAELNILKRALKKDGCHNRIIHIVDDNSFINEKRAELICRLLTQAETGLTWRGLIRASSITESIIDSIKKSGLQQAQIGVETGSPVQLKRMDKNQTVEESKKGIEILDSAGVINHLSFLVGFPGETEATINETIEFMNRLKALNTVYIVFPFYVLPFSKISSKESREEWGLEGIFSDWSHKTMNSIEARKNCSYLFKKVDNISYSYRTENYAFNRRFPAKELKRIYQLRQNLTVRIMDRIDYDASRIFSEMSGLMGLGNSIPEENILKEIYCPAIG